MLVDSQHGRASQRVLFGEMASQTVAEVALDGGGADALAPAHPAAVDAVEMLAEDGFAEWFTGMLPG